MTFGRADTILEERTEDGFGPTHRSHRSLGRISEGLVCWLNEGAPEVPES